MYTTFLYLVPALRVPKSCFLSLPDFACKYNSLFDVLYICGYFLAISDRLIGLPEGRARNHNRPQQVPVLSGVFIEDIAVGAEHTLALSSTGDVYAWGSNSEGQVYTISCLFLTFIRLIILYRCRCNVYLLVENQTLPCPSDGCCKRRAKLLLWYFRIEYLRILVERVV